MKITLSEAIMERPLTGDLRADGAPLTITEYEKGGGYEGLKTALGGMTPPELIEVVKASRLRGRGGAGFPTGQKWEAVPEEKDPDRPGYFISNSDEMEPGAFKDRLLMEGNPHRIIEGMIIGSYATGSGLGYIFLRREYGESAKRLRRAIEEAYGAGYLGTNILGSGFNLDLRIHVGAGRYICGEETALLSALEGRRAIPRAKPPFPQTCGVCGRPTVVNNAETLANIPFIIRNGAEWYKALSLSPDGGTKIYGVSGRVKRPGAWELPMGITMRELLEEHGGGMGDGYRFRGVLPGGGSTDFLLEEHLDTKMDFDSVQKAGSRLGTGTMIILDDRTCPVGMVANLERFFARESCGWCTPCREGLPWVARMVEAIESGAGTAEDLSILEEHTHLLGPGRTFCAHAPGAVEPLQSALKLFHARLRSVTSERRGHCPYLVMSSFTLIHRREHRYTVTADGKESPLQPASPSGLNLPYFCWHPVLRLRGGLPPVRREALQETTRTRGARIVMSCMTPVTDGLCASPSRIKEARDFRAGDHRAGSW